MKALTFNKLLWLKWAVSEIILKWLGYRPKSRSQYAEWDLKKTSYTFTGTLTGLFLMALRLKINIAWNPTLKGKFLEIPGRGIEPGTLKITTGGHPSKHWLGSMLLNFRDRTLKLSSVEPSQYLDGWPPLVIFRVPGSNPGMEFWKNCPYS